MRKGLQGLCPRQTHSNSVQPTQIPFEGDFDCFQDTARLSKRFYQSVLRLSITFRYGRYTAKWAIAADKIVFSMAELTTKLT